MPPNVATEQAARIKNPNGRGTTLTNKLIVTLTNAIKVGERIDIAACAAGISRETIADWLREGARLRHEYNGDHGWAKPPDTPTHQQRLRIKLSVAVDRAYAEASIRIGAGILSAGTRPAITITETTRPTDRRDTDGNIVYETETTRTERPPDWKALAWMGVHRFPESYAPPTRVEHSGPDGAAIPHEVRVVAVLQRVRDLRAKGGLIPIGSGPVDEDGIVDGEIVEEPEWDGR